MSPIRKTSSKVYRQRQGSESRNRGVGWSVSLGGTENWRERTHNVDEDGRKDGFRDGLAIGGIVDAADELLVAGTEEHAEDGEDDDCEDGHDGAIGPQGGKKANSQLVYFSRKMNEWASRRMERREGWGCWCWCCCFPLLCAFGGCVSRETGVWVGLTDHDHAFMALTTGFMMGGLRAWEARGWVRRSLDKSVLRVWSVC